MPKGPCVARTVETRPLIILVGGTEKDLERLSRRAPDGLVVMAAPSSRAAIDILKRSHIDSGGQVKGAIKALGLELGITTRVLRSKHYEIELSGMEYRLMYELMAHKGAWIDKVYLREKLWGQTYSDNTSLRQYASRLRKVLRNIRAPVRIDQRRDAYSLAAAR